MDDTITVVYCTVLFEGIHCWPECPFEEVKYLRDPHRHIFHIKAHKQVFHDDRDVEFIMLKHQVETYLRDTYPRGRMGLTSCEMLGRELMNKFGLIEVEVSEDGENGAIVSKVN
jgi:hypothetical protein